MTASQEQPAAASPLTDAIRALITSQVNQLRQPLGSLAAASIATIRAQTGQPEQFRLLAAEITRRNDIRCQRRAR